MCVVLAIVLVICVLYVMIAYSVENFAAEKWFLGTSRLNWLDWKVTLLPGPCNFDELGSLRVSVHELGMNGCIFTILLHKSELFHGKRDSRLC